MALKNNQYNLIMRDYEERRNETRHLLDSRREEIYACIPEYRELEREIVNISIEATPLMLEGSDEEVREAMKKLREQISVLSKKKTQLLIENGFSQDYLEPVYTCRDCKDTGYIDTEKCHCFKQAIVDILYKQSGIKTAIQNDNFINFKLDYYSSAPESEGTKSPRQIMTDNLNSAKSFVKNFDKENRNLYLYGEVGLGKTFLSNCIANELLCTGHTVLYQTAHELVNSLGKALRSRYDEDYKSDFKDYIFESDLLIIDDVGSEMATEFSISQLNECISERLLSKRSTIISSNLKPQELVNTYGDRLLSRILGNYDVLPFCGKDIRLVKKFGLSIDK